MKSKSKKWTSKEEKMVNRQFDALVKQVAEYKKTLQNKKVLDKTPKSC